MKAVGQWARALFAVLAGVAVVGGVIALGHATRLMTFAPLERSVAGAAEYALLGIGWILAGIFIRLTLTHTVVAESSDDIGDLVDTIHSLLVRIEKQLQYNNRN